MGRKPNQTTENPPAVLQAISENPEQNDTRKPRYVVVREGYRVSPEEYETPDDPRAIKEMESWKNIANKHSWGEPVEIVQYDNKLHRVW